MMVGRVMIAQLLNVQMAVLMVSVVHLINAFVMKDLLDSLVLRHQSVLMGVMKKDIAILFQELVHVLLDGLEVLVEQQFVQEKILLVHHMDPVHVQEFVIVKKDGLVKIALFLNAI
jgi:hypothetical protein